MDTYEPLQGSSYIELPKDIHDTKAAVNIKNDDQQCFKWFILAALHPASNHAERLTNYQDYKDELNFWQNWISCPNSSDIQVWETEFWD